MKILMVINNMRADSGVCSSVAVISNEMTRQGHKVYIASLLGKGSMIERLDIPEDNIIDLSNYKNILSKIKRLRFYIIKLQIDIVHTHMHRPGLVGRLAAWRTKSATIITEHSTYLPANKWRQNFIENLVDSFLARHTNLLIAVSHSVAATFASRVSIVPNLVSVIHNAVDTQRFQINRSRKEKNHKNGRKKILFAGRFAYEKHADLAIQVVSLLRKRGLNVDLIIAGSGVLENGLEKSIKKEHLEGCTKFIGAVTDMPILMRQMDVLLLTSYWEGCPMSIIEAYASGLPVVATSVSGVIDIVDNFVSGVLIDPDDPEKGADKLAQVLTDTRFSNALIENAYTKVEDFLPHKIALQYVACYKEAIERKNANA
jgi:glycosyltransferase involved in cell wall biosynthesis